MDTKQLKQKILDLAIRGKLVPQDPNDEPASVLLERIRAEKEQLIAQGKLKKSKSKISDKPHYENVPFEIPESWEWVTLHNISTIIGDGLHGTPQYDSRGDYYFINGNNLSEHKIKIKEDTKRVSENEYLKYQKPLNETSILVSINGTIGNVGTYNGERVILGKSACYINLSALLHKVYFCYLVESDYFIKYAFKSATGSTIKNVPLKAINEFFVPLPPFNEQKRIVEAIEQWFELIDQLERNKQDLQEAIKQNKAKVLALAIHGKLVPQDPNNEPAIELLKRINPNFKPCDTSHYENLPQGWCACHLNQVTNIARGGSPRPIKDYITTDANGINWIKIGDTEKNGKYINETKEKIKPEGVSRSRMIYKGDFLLTNSMSFGRPYISNIEDCIHDGWLVISPINNIYNKEFLYYLLSSSYAYNQFSEKASGTAVSNLNVEKVANALFPLPPLDEQKRIAECIETIFASLDTITAEL